MNDSEKSLLLGVRSSLRNATEPLTKEQTDVLADTLWLLFAGSFADDNFSKACDLLIDIEKTGLETRDKVTGKILDAVLEVAGY